jgi:hypothetical protein
LVTARHGLMPASDEILEADDEPRLLATWLAIQQAELMLQHMREAGTEWPDAAIYLHSCITAIRSVTATMQKALAHEEGFAEWYEQGFVFRFRFPLRAG